MVTGAHRLWNSTREVVKVRKEINIVGGITSTTDGTIEPVGVSTGSGNPAMYVSIAEDVTANGIVTIASGRGGYSLSAAGNATITINAHCLVYSVCYSELGAATPTLTLQENVTSDPLTPPLTATASVVNHLDVGNGLVLESGTVLKIDNGAAGDTWWVDYVAV